MKNVAKLDFTPELVALMHHCFNYNPETGDLIWRYRPEMSPMRNGHFAGRVAGYKHCPCGKPKAVIVNVKLGGVKQHIRAHRIIYSMLVAPLAADQEIDHKDGNPLNNRIANLRLATRVQNMHNIGKKKRKHSFLPKGVARHGKKYRASIMVNRITMNLGSFLTPELAGAAYSNAAIKHMGQFAKLC